MREMLSHNWWAFALRGIAALILGVLAFVVPGPTLVALIAVFAAYAVIDGILAIVAGAASPRGPRWWIIVGGVAGIAVGLFTIYSPGTGVLAVLWLIGFYAIFAGVMYLAVAMRLRSLANRTSPSARGGTAVG